MESQKKKNVVKIEIDEEKLCQKLDEINSRINDLIKILERMEKIQQQNNSNSNTKNNEKK